jgi:hypothetical protein
MAAVAVAAQQAAKYRSIREEQERRWEIIDRENQAMKQREELQAQAVRAEEELAARRESHAQAKRRSQSRLLVHKGVQPCLRSAARDMKRERRAQQLKHDGAAEAVALGVDKLNIDPALSDLVLNAKGPSLSVVGWNVSDESVRQLAALPYDEWKEEMRARKRQAEAEADAAAAAVAAGSDRTLAVLSAEAAETQPVHFSRRGKSRQPRNAAPARSKPKGNSADEATGRVASVEEMAECTFRPRTSIPRALALMRHVLDAPDDQLV